MFDCVALIKQPLGIVLGKNVHHGINPLHLYSLQLLEKYVIIITITKTRIFFFRITRRYILCLQFYHSDYKMSAKITVFMKLVCILKGLHDFGQVYNLTFFEW